MRLNIVRFFIAFGLTIVSGVFCEASPQVSQRAAAHLDEVIAVLRREWLFRDTVDWTLFRSRVFNKVGSARTIPETYDAIRLALTMLGDKHSWYRAATGQFFWNPESPTQVTRRCTPRAYSRPILPPHVGYIRIQITPQTPTATIQSALREGKQRRVDRWVVDLRNSRGGNMWPALAGIGPLVGDGTAGFFVDEGGHPTAWGYTKGRIWLGTDTVMTVDKPVLLDTLPARVAVLMDVGVASSGEAIAIAFRSRPNTRSFGTASCGLSTAVQVFRLSNGDAIGVVNAVMADRTGRKYGGPITPDEVINEPTQAIKSAVDWLLRR